MRLGTILGLGTFILAAVLMLLQMWLEVMDAELFAKVMITLGVVFVVVVGTTIATREAIENEKLRQQGYLD